MPESSSRPRVPEGATSFLALFIQDQADWRRQQARRFRDDPRNRRSAAALEELAATVSRMSLHDRTLVQLYQLGAFEEDSGAFRGGAGAKRALGRYRFDDPDQDESDVLHDLVVGVAEDRAMKRIGDVLEVQGPHGRVTVTLGPRQSAHFTAPDSLTTAPGIEWIDPSAVTATEEHVRVDQERLLADVLDLYDELTGLFVPTTSEPRPMATDQVAALVALESGLYGHIRAARAAVGGGRVQELITLGRTIEEIRKKAEVVIADPAFATRVAHNEHIRMKEVNERYAAVLQGRGQPQTPEQAERDRDTTDKSSWVIHARHRGLQFMALPSEGGSTITRDPRALNLDDRGRSIALWTLSAAGDAVLRIVPVLLKAFEIHHDEWRRRERRYADLLGAAALPFILRRRIAQREPRSAIAIDATGSLVESGRRLTLEEAVTRAGVSDEPDEEAAERAASDQVRRVAALVAPALSQLRRYWRSDPKDTTILEGLERSLDSAIQIAGEGNRYGHALRDAERAVHLLRTGARVPFEPYSQALQIFDGILREVVAAAAEVATEPNWWGGMPHESLVEAAKEESVVGQAAADELLRRGCFHDGVGNWVEDRPDTTIRGRSSGRIPSVRAPRAGTGT